MKKVLILLMLLSLFGFSGCDFNKEVYVRLSPIETTEKYSSNIVFIKEATFNGEILNTSNFSATPILVKPNKTYTLVWTSANKNNMGIFLDEETHRTDLLIKEHSYVYFGGRGEYNFITANENVDLHIEIADTNDEVKLEDMYLGRIK